MFDISWLSQEAHKIHEIFENLFYLLATLMILIGVVLEYFKMPLGGQPSFMTLIGRAVVAALLLHSYPLVSNSIAEVSDALASEVGSLNSLDGIIDKTANVLKDKSWSWTSIGDTLLWVISYLVYSFLYLTVFIFDAIILYGWTLAYIFSPILILLFILPQTASATGALYRGLFEMASYKVVWSVLGTLLWSTVLKNLSDAGAEPNFFVVMGFMVITAFSILFTPKVVKSLTSSGIQSVGNQLGALSAMTMSAGLLGPAGLAKLMTGSVAMSAKTGMALSKKGLVASKSQLSKLKSSVQTNIKEKRSQTASSTTQKGSQTIGGGSQNQSKPQQHYSKVHPGIPNHAPQTHKEAVQMRAASKQFSSQAVNRQTPAKQTTPTVTTKPHRSSKASASSTNRTKKTAISKNFQKPKK